MLLKLISSVISVARQNHHQFNTIHQRILPLITLRFSASRSDTLLIVCESSTYSKNNLFKEATLHKKSLKMAGENYNILLPEESVRGMTELNYEAFKKTIVVPIARVEIKFIKEVLDILKKYYLKVYKFHSTVACSNDSTKKIIYLCPVSFSKDRNEINDQVTKLCNALNADCEKNVVEFSEESITLEYSNWNAEDTLRSVLPADNDIASGFSIIGHILHLNLKDHLLPYKTLIGKVLLDKTRASLIVNKVDTIENSDNSYRSFNMEILAGEGDTIATVRESKCVFELDFAKVYWNPRLETEHSMIVKKMRREDVLYDVMAGVGPFSIPAAKNGHCSVLANDLNPESYKWLLKNCKLNKVSDNVSCYNLDGSEFIKTVLKEDLVARWKDQDFHNDIHIAMNLPAMAIEFLPNFVGLLKGYNLSELTNIVEPVVNVYMFSRDMKASSCMKRVAYYLGLIQDLPDFDGQVAESLKANYDAMLHSDDPKKISFDRPKFVNDYDTVNIPGLTVKDVRFVRKVSRNKIMMRVSFVLTKDILCGANSPPLFSSNENENPPKKIKLDLDN